MGKYGDDLQVLYQLSYLYSEKCHLRAADKLHIMDPVDKNILLFSFTAIKLL